MPAKILIYSDCFTYSGSENVIENILFSDLINENFDVEFCFANNKDYKKRFLERIGDRSSKISFSPIFILSRGYFMNRFRQKKNSTFKRFFSLMTALMISFLEFVFVAHLYNIIRLYCHFRKENVQILYINNGGYPGAMSCRLAVIAGKLAKIKHIIFNVNNMAYPSKSSFDRLLDSFLAKHVSCFLTASFSAQAQLIAVRGFQKEQFKRIPNTLFEENLKMNDEPAPIHFPNKMILGSVGLLTFRKGYHVLVDAARKLVEQGHCDFKIYLIGDGEERAKLMAMIMKYDLQEYVELLGFKSNPLVYLKHFDIFVLPSVSNEDFPYVILEAMYLSKPIVGTNVAGIPEQIAHGKNGYVVEPNSASELAEKILLLMSKKNMLDTMGEESRKIYEENFSYDLVMNSYFELFNSLIKK